MLSPLSLAGHLVPLFPRARWGAQAAGRGVGELKLVKTAYFGSPQLHIPRSVKELGGGALLDIRVYCLQHESVITGYWNHKETEENKNPKCDAEET